MIKVSNVALVAALALSGLPASASAAPQTSAVTMGHSVATTSDSTRLSPARKKWFSKAIDHFFDGTPSGAGGRR
jgi:hypothetical protein